MLIYTYQQGNITLSFPPGPFTQEILLLFNFIKDGGVLKISSVTEYVDSYKVKEFKEKRAAAGNGPSPSE